MLTDEELREVYNKAGTDEFQRLGLSLNSDKGFDGHLNDITHAALRAVFNAGVAEEQARQSRRETGQW